MKVSELRLGNLVKINDRGCDCIYRVTGISETDIDAQCINRCDPFKDVYNEPIENVTPSPLTEEWLVRFGLYQSKNKWGNTFHLMNEDGITADFTVEHWTNTKESSPYKNYWLIDKLGKPRQYYHVHQLQNLYFALCGEELTLNNQ